MAAASDMQQPPQFTDRASMWAAFHQMNSLGLIIVPQDMMSGQDDDVPFRETLSSEERRAALGEMLEFTPYRVAQISRDEGGSPNDKPRIREEDEDDIGEVKIAELEEGKVASSDKCTTGCTGGVRGPETIGPRSVAFPAHEAPETTEVTCAICLDDFDEGDLLNSQTKCPHRFHKDCLIMWLEHHDICPICRRVMVTGSDWREANAHGANSA